MSKKKRKPKPTIPLKQQEPTHDLVVLVADSEMEQLVGTLLTKRYPALAIRRPSFTLLRHPEHDPGCLNRPDKLLATFTRSHRYAIVLFDRMGCGAEQNSREELESEVEEVLAKNGWGPRAKVIVIDPELEKWIWSRSPHLAEALGWEDGAGSLYEWLHSEGWIDDPKQQKPEAPKEAVEAVRKKVRGHLSGAVYAEIAEKASVERCQDPAFHKFLLTLSKWFPQS